jgi:hypothetical protein
MAGSLAPERACEPGDNARHRPTSQVAVMSDPNEDAAETGGRDAASAAVAEHFWQTGSVCYAG